MRGFATITPYLRAKKSLSIGLVLTIIIVILLHQQQTIRGTIRGTTNDLLAKYRPPPLPTYTEWLHTPSAWMTDAEADEEDFTVRESFQMRSALGKTLNQLFEQYRPPIAQVNKDYVKRWPTMPTFQVLRPFDEEEIANASQHFFKNDNTLRTFKLQQDAFIGEIPTWRSVSKAYSGRGIVISAGRIDLERIWPLTVLMLQALNSTLPVEIWTKDQGEYDLSLPLVHQLRTELGLEVSAHCLAHYMQIFWDWNQFGLPMLFKVKALALLYSSFEQVIMLDIDSIPVQDPELLWDMEVAKTGLIQWPDFWSNSVSKVMHDTYDFGYSFTRSCESGQMLIDKSKQFEPLVMATYYNWYGPDFFHKLIYMDSMGAGDKDTFWLGSAALHRSFHVVDRPLELVTAKRIDGTLWKEGDGILNGAMAQFNPSNTSEVMFMHLHSPKINMQAPELFGQFDIEFFTPRPEQNVHFVKGREWLELKLWENLQWIECESILKKIENDVCAGITRRVTSMKKSTRSDWHG